MTRLIYVLLIFVASATMAESVPCHKVLSDFFGKKILKDARTYRLNLSADDAKKMDQFAAVTEEDRARLAAIDEKFNTPERGKRRKGDNEEQMTLKQADEKIEIQRRIEEQRQKYIAHLPAQDMLDLQKYIANTQDEDTKSLYLKAQNPPGIEAVPIYLSSRNSTLHFAYAYNVKLDTEKEDAKIEYFTINANSCQATEAWQSLCRLSRALKDNPKQFKAPQRHDLDKFVQNCKDSDGYLLRQVDNGEQKRVSFQDIASFQLDTKVSVSCACETFFPKTEYRRPYRTCSKRGFTKDGNALLQVVKGVTKDEIGGEELVDRIQMPHVQKFCAIFAGGGIEKTTESFDADAVK